MQTNYSPRAERDTLADDEPSISLRELFRVLKDYAHVIVIAMVCVMVGYAILAITSFLYRSPAVRVTSAQFRLDFNGAAEGQYPNGLKFSPVEIVSAPVLQRVYKRNELSRFIGYDDFARSIFVLESNPAYDALAADYQARLADPKLTAVDRDRIQKEFDMKRNALSKNLYALHFQHSDATSRIPDSTVRAALVDTLNVWADFAVNEQHAVDYRISVLSPAVIGSTNVLDHEYVPHLIELRSQVLNVIDNVNALKNLPGAELVKASGNESLAEIGIRLDEILRFRLDALMAFVVEKHLIRDPQSTTRFAVNQLAFDQRRLDAQIARADAVRQTIGVYTQKPMADRVTDVAAAATAKGLAPESVVISDTFLDKLVDLTTHSADALYRQKLANDYGKETAAIIPITSSVAYDRSIIEQLKSASGGGSAADDAYATQTLNSTRNEVRDLVVKLNEIYAKESANLKPATQLFTVTAAPATRIERTGNTRQLFIGGVLVFLITLTIVIGAVFVHSRLRREEAEAEAAEAAPASTPALSS